jgi:transcriptional regulator with XRE-family HTH domain
MAKVETLDRLIYLRGLPVTKLAKLARMSPRAVLDLRNGLVERPRVGTVAKLAKALGVDVGRVLAACEASRAAKG